MRRTPCRPVALVLLSALLVALATLAAACGDDGGTAADTSTGPSATGGDTGPDRFPDVVDATLVATGDRVYRVDATVSSPYDSPDRYADAWRVVAPDGEVLGVRELTHDHAGEQPFTRSLDDVEVPAGITEVTVEARDLANGWGGGTVTVAVPG